MKVGDLVRWIYINKEDEKRLAQGEAPEDYGHVGIVTHSWPDQFVIYWALDNNEDCYMRSDKSLSECLEVICK